MRFDAWLYKVSGHAELDEMEQRYHHGEIVKVTDGFYKGQVGTIEALHPATTLSHGWVGYSIKLDDGSVTEFIEVEDLEKIDALPS